MLLRHVMRATATCGPADTLEEAARTMWDEGLEALPVVDDDGRPVAVLTDRDIAMAALFERRPLADLTVGDLTAHRSVVSCPQERDLAHALELMAQHQVGQLPVADGAGALVGMLTMRELLAHTRTLPGPSESLLRPAYAVAAFRRICERYDQEPAAAQGGTPVPEPAAG